MAQMCIALYVGLSLHLLFATVLHQGAADFVSTPPPPPTTSPPHKGPGVPAQGDYSVKNETGTVCLKAKMALQINITLHSASLNTIVQKVVNLNPNETASSGSCDKERAILKLNSPQQTELTFQFTLNTTSKRYNLNSVSISASWPDMAEGFSAHNDSLDYLQGNLGFSYMCRSEQTLEVSQNFSLKTYFLHVQPFGLTGDAFGSALECLLDQDDLVIPIVVGAALAGLVLVVLLAYMIGRKRSHAGYQTI
ncbi:lysosome-associated membrane glycoprotein 1b [Eucyclogobius newberryi]|uniref:lysosome-associated membrane glycoprotein 1b n=1 Tax=Eucyclogobius newberryi TaxID=166745 RepID=UPI003B5BEF5F